jgi:hypothetical protein
MIDPLLLPFKLENLAAVLVVQRRSVIMESDYVESCYLTLVFLVRYLVALFKICCIVEVITAAVEVTFLYPSRQAVSVAKLSFLSIFYHLISIHD